MGESFSSTVLSELSELILEAEDFKLFNVVRRSRWLMKVTFLLVAKW